MSCGKHSYSAKVCVIVIVHFSFKMIPFSKLTCFSFCKKIEITRVRTCVANCLISGARAGAY